MQSDPKVVDNLNLVLRNELTADQSVFPPRQDARAIGESPSSASMSMTNPSMR